MSIEHNLITAVNNHGIVSGLGPYTSVALRQAQSGLTSADLSKVAYQVVSGVTTLWMIIAVSGGTATWLQISTAADAAPGPTGTDYGALAVSNGLTVIGYYRADYAPSVTGSSGTGKASWAPISGAMSAITPDGSATNGIGSATAGVNGRAGLKLNGATQMGAYTAPVLAAPGTTNWHRYWIARQASGGSGGVRNVLSGSDTTAYMVQLAAGTVIYAYGTGASASPGTVDDTWQRGRVSYTGVTATGEFKLGSNLVTGGGAATTAAPATARTFGSLLLNWEWLMYMEVTGPLANFHTFATAADAAAQTDWTSAVQI